MKKLFNFFILFIFTCSSPVFPIGKDNGLVLSNDFLLESISSTYTQQLGKFIPLSGNIEQMGKFFTALKNSKNHVIKIAHYGDSLIQGDIISEYLRQKLQETFGGKGAGFLSIVSNDIKMRQTTRHTYSDDWKYAAIITRNPDRLPFGISGSVAVPQRNSWVKYESTDYLSSTSSFTKVKIYYSNAGDESTIEYRINNNSRKSISLQPGSDVQETLIELNQPSTSIEIKFVSGRAPYFYGVSLESGNGIYLDNFPMPGNTGVSLLDIPKKIFQDFTQLIDYNLIILTYGANVSSPNRGIFNLYENKMINVIEELKKNYPEASILLVGVGDKTMKRGNRFITNPDVTFLLETQKRIVEKTKITFWNLWEAMGGENSMDQWVNSAPPLALKDYSHFTQLGGQRISQLLFESVMYHYQKIR